MNRQKRDQAVRVFMAKDKAQIMLMSLKCGGVGLYFDFLRFVHCQIYVFPFLEQGLNLTRANRVISLDLGWSEAVES
jgi:SNF2 family DNA or RNA helicase